MSLRRPCACVCVCVVVCVIVAGINGFKRISSNQGHVQNVKANRCSEQLFPDLGAVAARWQDAAKPLLRCLWESAGIDGFTDAVETHLESSRSRCSDRGHAHVPW